MKQKISLEQLCDPKWRREQQVKIKNEAIWVAFLELGGLINQSKLASEYMERTQSWFTQKLNRIKVNGKPRTFTADEAHAIAEAFRDIARRLEAHADEIDSARLDDECEPCQ